MTTRTKTTKTNNNTTNKSLCTLACDTRERMVTRHVDELMHVNTERIQMTTGDYSIKSPTGQILIIIERKSLDDYGASLKDGRHDNKNKLLELRAITGCRIMYIIEGPAFPDPNDTFSRIAYKNIESSIFHLMIMDNIGIIRTKDTLDTAKTLARLVISTGTLYERAGDTILNTNTEITAETTSSANELLTARKTRTDAEIAREMWSCFRGITVETASEYMRHWSIADIVRGRISLDAISKFRTVSGRAIASSTVQGLTNIDKRMEIRLLSTVPGVSTNIATVLLEKTKLSALLSYGTEMSIEVISRDKAGIAKRRLGEKLASVIVHHFNYRLNDTPIVIPTPTPILTPTITPILTPTITSLSTIPEISQETLASIDDFLAGLG